MRLLDFPRIEPNTPESIADRAVNRIFNGHPGESKRFTREELKELLVAFHIIVAASCRPQVAICTGEDKTIHVHAHGDNCEVCEVCEW